MARLSSSPGAVFDVIGSFNDSFVIGRDSGSGTVIQNGGIFTFNCNQQYLWVGATSNPGTRSEYDMNGGLLDMSGNTLGIGLGNGVLTTGVVNQVSGVITNVYNLWVGWGNGQGVYTLSGGSIYIGATGITTSGNYAINLGGGTVGAEANWASLLNMNLTNLNGSVTFDTGAGNTITLSGALSGKGGLIVTDSGTLILSGANTYTGDTVVNAGSTLQLNVTGSDATALRLANGALLNLNYSGNYAVAAFYTNGVALPVGTYNNGNLPGFITANSGNLVVASSISKGFWYGGGADNNWSMAGNWDQNAVPIFPIGLTFVGPAGWLTNNNDLSSITAASITFDSAAGAFVLGGNDITLSGDIGFNGNPAAPVTQTVNLNMAWNADQTIDTPTNGNLTLGGNITSGNALIKADAGTLTLGGVATFDSYTLVGGTNTITGNTTINGTGGGSIFYPGDGHSGDGHGAIPDCNGTLIIQPGAALTVTGTFGDQAVIGRDSGSGTIVQNGGTFTFNPSSMPSGNLRLLLGATGDSHTRAEYDMNGGLLDMNGDNLSVGWGNQTGTTGLLNQVGGVITNVNEIRIPTTGGGGGLGIYTFSGGSVYLLGGGIVNDGSSYVINLGGGAVGAEANWASSLNMTLTGSNGPVTFDTAGNTITLLGTLSGTGGLTVAGSGILDLSEGNVYTGDTVVSAGSTLELDAMNWSYPTTLRLANGSKLNLTSTGNYTVLGCYTNGVALPLGTYNHGNLPTFITGSGNLVVAATVIAQTVGFTADTTQEQYGTYQNFNGGLLNIGRQMTVTGGGIEVFQLGFFDYQGDGLATAHTVTLFNSAATPIASVTVPAGTAAPLINAFRFAPLGTPLYLPAGNYSLLAYQMNSSDPYGNGNAPGFNGGGNVSPGAGVYHFTSNPSPDYWTDTSGEDFASVSFTYVNAVTTPPVVNHPVISGGNLILTGSGGTAGAGYTWLTSTNVATPIASWTTNTTGNFDGSGNFSNAIPVTRSVPAKFFRLRTP
jgi:autotransporter-associated beta strand protein